MGSRGNLVSYRLREGLIFAAMLPLLFFLFLSPEPSASQPDDYLPSARSRNVAVYLVKFLKSLPGEKVGFPGGDVAVGTHPRQIINLVILLGSDFPAQLRPFERLTRQPARSPPNPRFSLV